MKLFLVAALVVLCSCSQKEKPKFKMKSTMDKICSTKEEKKIVADFVIKCAEAANPLSDEEGEDLVLQCHRTGESLLCPLVETCWPDEENEFLHRKDCSIMRERYKGQFDE